MNDELHGVVILGPGRLSARLLTTLTVAAMASSVRVLVIEPPPAPELDVETLVLELTRARTKVEYYVPLRQSRRERTHPNEPWYRQRRGGREW